MELLIARPDFDVEKLAALLELEARFRAERAAEAFADALTAFQSEVPMVLKGRQTISTDKFEGYNFASYDDVMRAARPLLTKFKIVPTFTFPSFTEGRMTGTCRIRVGTHFEETTAELPVPTMKVCETQKFAAAISYLKRYLLCAALNIVTSNEDNDAATQFESVTEAEAFRLNELITEKQVSPPLFLNWVSTKAKARIERLDDVPRSVLAEAMDFLARKKAPTGGAK
jgi:ERF superfamily